MNEEKRYWLERDFMVDLLKQLPAYVFWKNTECTYLGCNDAFAKALGFSSAEEIIGKSDYDLPIKKEQSDQFREDDQFVMNSLQPKINIEEKQIFLDGRELFLLTSKVPLLNPKTQQLMGVLGIYHDITNLKKNEILRLKLKNEVLEAQESFSRLAQQVVHDIRSPLASLLMIVKSCQAIPEEQRIALREAAMHINDIANHLLNHYKKENKTQDEIIVESTEPTLLSVLLSQVLTDKKYQYRNLPIQWLEKISTNSYFAFVRAAPASFKRMLSNLINNAVDAFEGKSGNITIQLEADVLNVKIKIIDNGKGMPQCLLDKLNQRIPTSYDKKSGHGIGMTQVWDSLKLHHAELEVISAVGEGSSFTLTLPKVNSPSWIAEKIIVHPEDILIILDDDSSIHAAWNSRFLEVVKTEPSIQLMHFQTAVETICFVDSLDENKKNKTFLLTDYELLNQELNGLDVVDALKIERALLVTSHFANPSVRERAMKTQTKILPKQLASEIIIELVPHIEKDQNIPEISAVIVDDNESFINILKISLLQYYPIAYYYDPEIFLEEIEKYKKDIKIFIDQNYDHSSLNGLQIAEILHTLGYQYIYLLSGEDIQSDKIPDYITVIRKIEIEKITDFF